jgi:hypothetical protein
MAATNEPSAEALLEAAKWFYRPDSKERLALAFDRFVDAAYRRGLEYGGEWRAKLAEQCGKTLAAITVLREIASEAWSAERMSRRAQDDDETERYRESNNHVLKNWTMRLNAHYLDLADGTLSSGMVRSKMTFLGGYFEARLRLPHSLGTWEAFWLNSSTRSDGALRGPPEIDILEAMHSECCEPPWIWYIGGAARTPPYYQDNSILAKTDPLCTITASTSNQCKSDNFNETWSYYYNWNAAGTDPEFLYNDFHVWGLLWKVENYTIQERKRNFGKARTRLKGVAGNTIRFVSPTGADNAAERALRGVALGRRSWLFAGSDRGGERAAAMYTLIATAKLNDINPQAWLAGVLRRINDHRAPRG